MEGILVDYYNNAVTVLTNAFGVQHALYTNVGITIGMAAVAAFVIVGLLIKLLGEAIMATGRIIQQRLLSFEEVRLLNAKQMRKCIIRAVGNRTISKEQGDLMLEQMAKRFSRWEYLPKRTKTVPPAAVVKERILARLPKDKLPDLTPKPAKTKLGQLFAGLQTKTATA